MCAENTKDFNMNTMICLFLLTSKLVRLMLSEPIVQMVHQKFLLYSIPWFMLWVRILFWFWEQVSVILSRMAQNGCLSRCVCWRVTFCLLYMLYLCLILLHRNSSEFMIFVVLAVTYINRQIVLVKTWVVACGVLQGSVLGLILFFYTP